jgi:hypothetical protein
MEDREPRTPAGTPGPVSSNDLTPSADASVESNRIDSPGELELLINQAMMLAHDVIQSTKWLKEVEHLKVVIDIRKDQTRFQVVAKHVNNTERRNLTQVKGSNKRKRGPNAGTLGACQQAMKAWLDDDKSLYLAAQTFGTDRKTVERWIPEVLEQVDPETRARWIAKIRIVGNSDRLGRFREYKGS